MAENKSPSWLYPIIVALATCFIIYLPLLSNGYIQTFDMIWGPSYPTTSAQSNVWLLFGTLHTLSHGIPSWVLQYIILFTLVILLAYGIFTCIKNMIPRSNPVILYFVSLLGIFNPFFYTRLITGQWLVLLGYALLPWAIRSFYIFIKSPTFKTAWPVAAWMTAIGLTSIHTIGIAFVAFIGLAIYAGRNQWKQKLKWFAAIVAAWCILNALWLAPLIAGQSNVGDDIKSFSRSEMQAFATDGTVLDSPPISAALLTGFWADDTNRYILPSHLPIWWVGVLIIMTLVIIGIVQVIRRRDRLGYTFIGLGVVAWLLGIGIAWNVSAPLTELLIKVIPYYNGYREPHKWLMLLALVYTYLAAIGAQWAYTRIAQYKSEWLTYGLVTTLFISPFLFAPTLAWGAAGQLKSVQYPQQWQQAKTYLNTHATKDTKVLVLPWHMYMPISFVGRVVGNPSGYYFDQHIITGNNFELKGVSNQKETPLTTYINNTLVHADGQRVDVAAQLRKNDVDYILLLKEADWRNYTWLVEQKDLVPVVTNDKILLYKIKGGH